MKPHVTRLVFLLFLAVLLPATGVAAESLWQKGKKNHVSLIADNRAHRVGDIVTIVVDEQQDVSNKETLKTDKSNDAKAEIPVFTPDQDAADEFFPIEWNYDSSFEGKADFDKQGKFATLITAAVVDVQPNGNLVIEGRRKVVLDGEEKWMTVTGMVRSFDVANDNTVKSALVANATVTYESCGPLARQTEAGWLERFLDFIWPF
ncbi:MAG: flagellar basal body L-ring protein FlgH [Planctomycetes bacterium]|nr:flagellar basal body L-ring protein FlgH [Planctomycetota bacterium]